MRRVASTDGVQVAVHDLGGDGPSLLMVHANGFCSGVFQPMAALLAKAFHCWALDLRGHGHTETPPSVDYRWDGFADDVLAAVDELGIEGGFGFGHSCGGSAVLGAEARWPGAFRGLYCFEPILWPEPPDIGPRMALIEGALRRRDTFASGDEALANFSSKPPLSALAPEVLRAYVECGFADEADGTVRLRCAREVESTIYRTGLTHHGFSRLAQVGCPVVIARGVRSLALDREVLDRQLALLADGRLETFETLGHLGPLENPSAVAAEVLAAFAFPPHAGGD